MKTHLNHFTFAQHCVQASNHMSAKLHSLYCRWHVFQCFDIVDWATERASSPHKVQPKWFAKSSPLDWVLV